MVEETRNEDLIMYYEPEVIPGSANEENALLAQSQIVNEAILI